MVLRRGDREIDFARPPEIADVALPYLSAFYQLMEQRHIDGMGAIGAIRYEAVTQWLDQQGIDDALERDRYRYYITACDREYMSVIREEREREQKRNEAKLKQHSVGRR